MLQSIGAIAALLVLGLAAPAVDAKTRPLVGVQLYSVRDDCAKDFLGTIAAVGRMGYDGVEFAGYFGKSAEEIRSALDAAGLKSCGTHTGLDSLLGDSFDATVKFNKVLGNKYLIVPGLSRERTKSREAWLETARRFNEIAKKLKPHGMVVGYHNHTGEFKPLDGEVPFELFFSNTSRDVVMQVDVGHAVHGGADVVKLIKQYRGRAQTVHFKEWDPKSDGSLVGEGIVPWRDVLSALVRDGGTQWLIVEQEGYATTPMDSIQRNLANVRNMLRAQR